MPHKPSYFNNNSSAAQRESQHKFQRSCAGSALSQSNPPGHKHPSDMRVITNSLSRAESERRRPSVDPALPPTPWHKTQHWQRALIFTAPLERAPTGKCYRSLMAPLRLCGLLCALLFFDPQGFWKHSFQVLRYAHSLSSLCTKQTSFFPLSYNTSRTVCRVRMGWDGDGGQSLKYSRSLHWHAMLNLECQTRLSDAKGLFSSFSLWLSYLLFSTENLASGNTFTHNSLC